MAEDAESKESFMEYVRREKWRKKAEFQKGEKRQHRKPLAYEKSAEREKRFNEILPEPEVPFEGESVKDLKISFEQGGKRNVLEMPEMKVRQYEVKKNPNNIFLLNVSSAKMYYDIENDCYWL